MKIKISIPENKSEIKLSDYLKLENFDKNDLPIKIMEVFFNISYNEFRTMNPNDYNSIIEQFFKVFEQKSKFKQIITIDGVEYGFIPKFDDITTGELIDLDQFLIQKDYFSLLSILYRPIVTKKENKYTIKKYDGIQPELFKNIDLETFEGCIGFFLTLLEQLGEITLKYLVKMTNKEMKKNKIMTMEQKIMIETFQLKMNSMKNGMGIFNFSGV